MMDEKNTGLITAYIFDGNGFGKKVGWNEVLSWSPDQGLLWVHLNYTAHFARDWLVNKSGLKKNIRQALMVEESRPRAVFESCGLLLFLRSVNLNPGHDPEDMVSMRIWVEKNRVITTRRRPLLSISDLGRELKNQQAPKTASELVALLSEKLTDSMSEVVNTISDKLDELEDAQEQGDISKIRRAISELRRESIMIRRYLSPQREAINRLVIDQSGFFSPVDLIQLREVGDRVQRYIEELDSVRDRAAVLQEEVSTRLSEQINNRIYMLSLVAVIFLPLSFVTGLLGINVGGIPGGQYQYGFWVVVASLAFLGSILIVLFRRKKWI